MKLVGRVLVAAAVAMTPVAAAHAGWKMVDHGVAVQVAKSKLTVLPAEDWNRSSHRAGPKGETWSLDGPGINELYFLSGLAPTETVFKDADKKNKPLPPMGANLQLNEVPEFFESSIRVSYNTSLFEVTEVKPMRFLDQDGVRFTYEFAAQDNPMRYKGVAEATLIKGKLYLISFTAPTLYFFDRDSAKAEAIMASARL